MTLAPTNSRSAAPSGAASGDLSGTYPGPTVAKLNGVTLSGSAVAGRVITATSASAADWEAPPTGTVNVASVQVSAAELKAMHAAPNAKVLLAAPAGRNYHVVLAVVLHYRFVTVPYVASDSRNLYIGYGTDPTTYATTLGIAAPSGGGGGDFSSASLLQQTADAYAICAVAANPSTIGYTDWLAASVEAVAVGLGNVGAAFSALGDSTLTVRIWYSTIDGAP